MSHSDPLTPDQPVSPVAYGHSLKGFGVNLLVKDMGAALSFATSVLGYLRQKI